MGRGARPAKAKGKTRVPTDRKSPRRDAPGRRELEERLAEAREQQAATSEILRVISQSPSDAQPVFDTIARSAMRLCDAAFGVVSRYDGELLHLAAHTHITAEGAEVMRQMFPMRPGRSGVNARVVLEGKVVHLPDAQADADYSQSLSQALRLRSALAVPMLRDGRVVGTVAVGRIEVRPFTDNQIALLQTFADQAVIAIENVRLLDAERARTRELAESLQQQTATADVLKVISRSAFHLQTVLDTLCESAVRLCDADHAWLFQREGEMFRWAASFGHATEVHARVSDYFKRRPVPVDRGSITGRAALEARVVQVSDVLADPEYAWSGAQEIGGYRAALGAPLLREGNVGGVIFVAKTVPQPFTDRQIELVTTFADQAVIAIENARLFKEVEARNRDLTEALDQQTATSEVLKIISRSTFDLQPVLETLIENATRLCGADAGVIYRLDGELQRLAAVCNVPAEFRDFVERNPLRRERGSVVGRALLEGRAVQIDDVLADPEYRYPGVGLGGYRTILGVPMVREGVPIGVFSVWRSHVLPFTDKQIELVTTFADQGAIAIENVRLFKELEARNSELSAALEQQTATSEILRVISSSPTDVQPVFDAIAAAATNLCAAENAGVFLFDGALIHFAAHYNWTVKDLDAIRQTFPRPPGPGTVTGRAILTRAVAHTADIATDPGYEIRGFVDEGFHAILSVPMLRDGAPIGAISVTRREAVRFTDGQIALLKTFADQAVIAVENVRLFQELEARTRELTRSVGELRALGEVSQAVGSTLDLETVLATIVSRAVQLSGSEQGITYEFDEASQTFQARATHQITAEYLETVRAAPIRLGEGVIGRAGVAREPVQVADIQTDWRSVAPQVRDLLAHSGMRSMLAIPLVREERLLGGLVILRRERGAFSPEVVGLLQTFATQSVLAIHNAGLFREIHRQKQYSDALVEASPVAITTLDLNGTVVGWNPGAERLFGYAQGEALGRQIEDLVATPEVREEVRANMLRTQEGGRIHAISRRVRKDGTLVDVEISSVPVILGGARVGIIAIYHDITELLQARREAEAANEAKSAFLATMSHEIRTPMNAVIGMSGLLLNTPLTEEQREYAEVIRQSGDALLTIINDILDFSKIEAGKLELESQPFDLRECVESTLDLVATRAAEKGLDLAYLVGDGVPAGIAGDVTRLRQILLNLLSNAVKFTERGEVVLSVSARRLDQAAPLHELTFSVRDTGIGIPRDRLGRLFQSFSQVDASTTRRYGGSGLGLAISQRLTELMGGRIDVASEVGKGSEFRFTIRAPAAEAPVTARRDLSGVQPSLRGKRVLVVDDNATNRRILTAHLDAWGMQSRATGSPAEALAWVRSDERFNVAILDMHMPEMDGVALARAIRESPAGGSLPLILFTSLGRREAHADSEGFAAYLSKPIKPSQLFDALVSVLPDQPVHAPQRLPARSEFDPEMARRHPLRILLAEDNVVNQKLALRLLAQMGYRADLAANGLEAIDAVERQAYDVVLMDVQMPELDGFEASREITRRWPEERRPRIVAITANAMQGDRELCAAAGMDDYVAKPIRVEELVAALGRCRLRAHADERRAPAEAAIDRTVVERLTATMGGPFVADLIDTFAEDGREQVAALRRSLAESRLDDFRRAAHSLKSNGETLGATGLAALARELEAMARRGSLDGAGERLEPLAREHERAADALAELRRDLLR